MSSDRDTTRIVRSWLEEGVTALPDRILDGVLDQLPATYQRRSRWRRLTLENDRRLPRFTFAAAAVVLVAVLGLGIAPAILPPNGGAPTPSPSSSPSPSPAPTAQASADELFPSPLAPGAYSLDGFPVGVTFTLPSGWAWCIVGPVEQSVCREGGNGEVGFLIVDNVVADPCSEPLLDPPVGPSVDDLVSAISGLSDFTATTPTDITVDGFRGKELTVTSPDVPACAGPGTWATADRTNGVGPAEANLIRIVDVNGTRVVMTGAYFRLETGAADALEAIVQIMDSVTFTP